MSVRSLNEPLIARARARAPTLTVGEARALAEADLRSTCVRPFGDVAVDDAHVDRMVAHKFSLDDRMVAVMATRFGWGDRQREAALAAVYEAPDSIRVGGRMYPVDVMAIATAAADAVA